MASWTMTASVLMAKTTSEVRTSVSKNWMSWFRAASKYLILIFVDCLSPVHIQHDISAKKFHPNLNQQTRTRQEIDRIFGFSPKFYLPRKKPISPLPQRESKTRTAHKQQMQPPFSGKRKKESGNLQIVVLISLPSKLPASSYQHCRHWSRRN